MLEHSWNAPLGPTSEEMYEHDENTVKHGQGKRRHDKCQ